MTRWSAAILGSCLWLLISGCDSSPQSVLPPEGASETPATDSSEPNASAAAPATAAGSEAGPQPEMKPVARPEIPRRDSFTGNWLLSMMQIQPSQDQNQPPQVGDAPLILLLVESATDADGKEIQTVRLGDGRGGFENFELSEIVIDGDRVEFNGTYAAGSAMFAFQGRFKDGLVLGSFCSPGGLPRFARLIPTDERTFLRIPPMIPIPEVAEFAKLENSPVPDADLREFIENHPASPTVSLAFRRWLQIKMSQKAPESEIQELIAEFVARQKALSERLGPLAEYEAFASIAPGKTPEWTIERSKAIEALVADEPLLAELGRQCQIGRDRTEFNLAVNLLDSLKDDERVRGRELAARMLEHVPYAPLLVAKLADDTRENGRIEEAIDRYGELVALPLQEWQLQKIWANEPIQRVLPSSRLEELWKEKHGNTDGLKAFIRQIYDEKLCDFVKDPVTVRPEGGNRNVLCELFTGARCFPCVAANVALDGIAKTYPQNAVISLRYHMHIPGHDPLANEDGEARFNNFYRSNATPAVFLNGRIVANPEGYMTMAPGVYQTIRTATDELLAQKTDVAIQLTAGLQDGTIQFGAVVSGADPGNKNLKLRVVLAESGIEFAAANGLLRHDLVVRKMLNGDRGTAPDGDKFEFNGSVKIESLRDDLHAYLTRFEKNMGVEFGRMPLELENLSIVAFVQDQTTHEVLQSAIVPVQAGTTVEQAQ